MCHWFYGAATAKWHSSGDSEATASLLIGSTGGLMAAQVQQQHRTAGHLAERWCGDCLEMSVWLWGEPQFHHLNVKECISTCKYSSYLNRSRTVPYFTCMGQVAKVWAVFVDCCLHSGTFWNVFSCLKSGHWVWCKIYWKYGGQLSHLYILHGSSWQKKEMQMGRGGMSTSWCDFC